MSEFIGESQIPEMRKNEQPYSLLLRPTAQIALFRGLTLAIKSGRLNLAEAVQRANKIDWRDDLAHLDKRAGATGGSNCCFCVWRRESLR
ncbi:MAG TPA: hypothetical protein DDZ80_29685 [Cyanobacteria bacterium UBA8803]|nr:hypothetical protein [Cyanobacteria bacterium UBA8803]